MSSGQQPGKPYKSSGQVIMVTKATALPSAATAPSVSHMVRLLSMLLTVLTEAAAVSCSTCSLWQFVDAGSAALPLV